MKELGISHKHAAVESPSNASNKSYPSMTIDHKHAMAVKNKKVGSKGHMKVKYRVTGQQSYRDGTGHTNLDITHAEDMENEGAKQ